MSNIFSNPFAGEQKATSWERVFADHALSPGDRAGAVLQLRQFPTGTGFVRTVNCAPGQLTVLTGDYEKDSKQFRDALVGRPSSTPVTMRYGTDDVSPSEIFSVGVFDILSDDLTVSRALERAHVQGEDAKLLLSQARLSAADGALIRDLDESSRRQLSILVGLFSRTRFVLFDRPFLSVSSGAIEPLAEMMLRAAQVSKRIVVITGVEKIPEIWKNSRDVHFSGHESRETRTKSKTLRIQREIEPEAADSVRSMIQGNRLAAENGDFIYTRPMIINPSGARQASGGRLQNESIANPHFAEIVGVQAAAAGAENEGSKVSINGAAPKAPRDSARRKRANTGTLTRVSTWELIKRRLIGKDLIEFLQSLTGSKKDKSPSGLTLSAVTKVPGAGARPVSMAAIAVAIAIVLAVVMYFI